MSLAPSPAQPNRGYGNFASRKRYPKSPLRYPGGKARAVEIVLALIPTETETLVSPFLGGGSIEIAAATLGMNVIAYDVFDPLLSFWRELLADPERLAARVEQYYPLSREEFYQLQRREFTESLDQAAMFYVLNRASFSGATLSGGMSPGHPRFTASSIDYLRNFKCPRLTVARLDYREAILKHQDELLYLDPPYLISSTLYGRNGSTHRDFDHEALSQLLNNRSSWILSYNDCPEIRELYRGRQFFTPQWKYGMSNDKNSRELIILSDDFAMS